MECCMIVIVMVQGRREAKYRNWLVCTSMCVCVNEGGEARRHLSSIARVCVCACMTGVWYLVPDQHFGKEECI